jgi:hypothetical protein
MEEGGERACASDTRMTEYFPSVLQFVTDGGNEFAARGAARGHEYPKEPIWTGQLDGHMEASPYAQPTFALQDVHQPVGSVDGFDQAAERGRPLNSLRDSHGNYGMLRTDSRDLLHLLSAGG